MAKILTLDVTSFKFADNETDLKFRALQNGVIISDSTLSATIKIKQADIGYLKSVSAKWVDKHIVISSGDLSDLPVGSYLLELWLSSSSGYEIYPDSGFVKLSINQNATGISGNLISSITLGEFQQQFSDLAKEVNNKIDDLHAQTDSNTSNIELKANQTDLESLQSTVTSQGIEVTTARGTAPTLNDRLNKMDDKDVEITAQLAQNILLKNDEFEIGTITGNTPGPNLTRVRMKNMLHVYKGDIIKFQKDPNLVKYGISISDLNGVWRGVDYGWLNQPEFIIKEDSLIKLVARYVDNRVLDKNMLKTLTENMFTIVRSIRNYVDDKFNNIGMDMVEKNTAIGSILVEYGRINGASYVFARIPKTMNNGSKLVPKVALTSRDGSLSGTKRSALNYARDKDTIFTLNAGLFNVSTVQPVGQLIIDGASLINTPMTSDNGVPIHPDECYPLAIDGNGNLKTYPKNADTANMIADGVKYAVTAWGKLVDNFEITTIDIDNEIVHNGTKYIRQSIGQYQNGDYCVCSVDMTRGPVTNEAGLYYKELAQLFVDKGVKFAYSLDGGGSTETVIGKRQLNPIYEGSDGRAVPTVITFEIVN